MSKSTEKGQDRVSGMHRNRHRRRRTAPRMQVVVDDKGRTWLCPVGVDTSRDLESQGCWRKKG